MAKNIYYTDVRINKDIIYFTGFNDKKERILKEIRYKPILFEKTNQNTKWKSIYGEKLNLIQFDNIYKARAYTKENPDYYGFERWVQQFLGYKFSGKPTTPFEKLKIYAIDIETTANRFPDVENPTESLLCITIVEINSGQSITFSSVPFDFKSKIKDSKYCCFENEAQMVAAFLEWWTKNYPHIITGWNIGGFDMPYIVARLNRISSTYKNYLSPHGIVHMYSSFDSISGREEYTVNIYGIQELDYYKLYRKFSRSSVPNYKLDTIAKHELHESKTAHEQYATFKEFYENDYNLFLEYNQQDAFLIQRLEEKLSLIKLAVTMATDAKANFEDCLYPIRIWDCIIFNYLNAQGVVIPGKVLDDDETKIVGARVKQPVPGFYNWIVTFDLTSLYPSIIMGLNISPETLEPDLYDISKEKVLGGMFKNDTDSAIAGNGAMYRKDFDGFLPVLIDKKFKERKEHKKVMFEKAQQLELIKAELERRGLSYDK